MSTETRTDRDRAHGLLLALAGRVPDDGLALMRTFLADDEEHELAQFLAAALGSGRLTLTEAEETTASELVARYGDQVAPLGPELRLDELPAPAVLFDAVPTPDVLDDGVTEQVAVEAAGRLAGLQALWRTWRTPSAADPVAPLPAAEANPFSGEAPDRDPRLPVRVFLAEVTHGADPVELAAELQQWLVEVGEEPPRVEVFGPDTQLSPYHEAALAGSALLWSAEPATEARLARAFDGADAVSGPYFHPDHPRVEGADRDALLSYLTGAEAVLRTPGTMADVVDADRGAVVPMSFRSDGVWIWPDTVAYYLREHGLAPDSALADHIRSVGGPPTPLDRLSRHRVMSVLARPAPETPAWRVE